MDFCPKKRTKIRCLISGVDGGGVSDEFVSTRKSGFRREFSVIANMLKRVEPLDNSIFSKGVSDSAKDSMKQKILPCSGHPNAKTEDDIIPLLSVVAAGLVACLELLIKAGAAVNITAAGATPLQLEFENYVACLLLYIEQKTSLLLELGLKLFVYAIMSKRTTGSLLCAIPHSDKRKQGSCDFAGCDEIAREAY
ncbi:hypothetical protein CASFOL_028369 [Castilleja foliolosa]|uniref:Ankyrin repeat protein n=1 Tax=Castilleja foliolosa TaxID=1961234 RepID=A0ABD3CB23_9LAMI